MTIGQCDIDAERGVGGVQGANKGIGHCGRNSRLQSEGTGLCRLRIAIHRYSGDLVGWDDVSSRVRAGCSAIARSRFAECSRPCSRRPQIIQLQNCSGCEPNRADRASS